MKHRLPALLLTTGAALLGFGFLLIAFLPLWGDLGAYLMLVGAVPLLLIGVIRR